ncbi:unnamed protein product [Schistosoma rodhaini]|uniref:Uncharacterized protein n=1 Tax=Schistosoma rodhaini TaxID=6188 RepID=A0AA85ERY4_9TREM|nr:unnamed protein product [Schistosoma rodhaini]
MNKPNSSITSNHYYAIDLQTDFQLQTPCISNFLDYDLSPSELHNNNNNNNNNNLLEGGGEQCQEISKMSQQQHHQHHHHHQQQQQEYQPNHTDHPQQYGNVHYINSHLSNYPYNQYLQSGDCLINSTINPNMNDMTMSIMKKIGIDNYFSSELQIPINQISSSHSKSTFNFGKRQAFHDFKELLLDIYHDENESFINKDQDNISNGSQYPRPSSIVSSTSNSITSINQNQSTLYNDSNDIHRIDPISKRHKELPTSKENSDLYNGTESFINNQVNDEHIYLNGNNNNNLTKIQESKLINSKLPKSKLELKFLLNQDNTIHDISKYGKVAKTIITKNGLQKLFVIRGRVIDTRIQFHYLKFKNNTLISCHGDNDIGDNNEEDIDFMKNHKFKLRFKPFTIFGGICTPAIGYNDPMQIPNLLTKQEQLCFIQAVQNDTTTNNNITYKLMNDGYLVMEIDFHHFCDIYHLVFPFLNSKCPSTWKKDVHITVTLIDEYDNELSSTEFEVVSCASPIRDARRYQQRQRIAEVEFTEKNLHKTTVNTDSLFEWDHQTSQSVSQSTSKLSISDISPSSSGFGSLYSPLPSITSEEDHFNELQLYLARNEASTPSHHITASVTTDSIGTINNNNSSISDGDNQKSDILSPSTSNDELIDLSNWDRLKKLKHKRLISNLTDSYTTERNPRNLFKQSTQQMSSKTMNSKYAMKRQVKEIDNGSCDGQEYVIKTKSRRIYRILSLLNRELSRHL